MGQRPARPSHAPAPTQEVQHNRRIHWKSPKPNRQSSTTGRNQYSQSSLYPPRPKLDKTKQVRKVAGDPHKKGEQNKRDHRPLTTTATKEPIASRRAQKVDNRRSLGIEPRTSHRLCTCTQSENHTTRPTPHHESPWRSQGQLGFVLLRWSKDV